jgi:alanyl-tRNA synthetase
MTSRDTRQAFLNFFGGKSHQLVPSAPMVVKNDPTLMFTNAGMNQFKDIFLGNSPVKHPRVANTQKCLRVSGKHNDLEEVGHDTYHHTMFEMLGNWSFGDYFKKEAIDWAWEFLVDVLKIDSTHLYATVFEGSFEDGLEADTEALDLWKKHLPSERVLMGSRKDNFWEMGDSGPCGPCSEIHVDIRTPEEKAKIAGSTLVNTGHPQVIEIWNLVFIQYNRKTDGSLTPLPSRHVDTGMGFERLCMVLQGKQSNYDTDVFQPIIQQLAQMSGIPYGANNTTDIAMRVVADHLRAISFSIADGQLPSNVKAGYVIRRILRRAVRYGYTFLNFKEPFINKLVETLAIQMGTFFPELNAQKELVAKVIHEEEASFLRTLETGIRLLDGHIDSAKKKHLQEISGKEAFILYDTYGFPLDLTELILRENNLTVNRHEFEKEMEAQKERSRNDAAVEAHDWVELRKAESTEFVGYDSLDAEIQIVRYRSVKAKGKEQFHLVFDRTPFYAESGGQVGDSGILQNQKETVEILTTFRENNLIVHLSGNLPTDSLATFTAKVDVAKRQSTANNHTATHLLHHALRTVLGNHVEQKGSLVHPDHLRFDFSHFQKMTDEEIRQVERLVNADIRKNLSADEHRDIAMETAKVMGAIALFGEKYGDSVRVLKFGNSVELCGGTHVSQTGSIGLFKIISESAISAGIRRIEAITGEKAEEFLYEQVDTLKGIRNSLGATSKTELAVEKLLDDNATLRKELETLMRVKALGIKKELTNSLVTRNGVNIIATQIEALSPDAIKDLCFQIRNEIDNLFLVLGAISEGKALLTVMVSDNLVKEMNLNASSIVREAAKEIQGGGGGQPFYATAGGKNPANMGKAIEKALELSKL